MRVPEVLPQLRWRTLHLLAVATLAITQPLLSILGDNPTFFTAHDATSGQIVWFAILVAAIPATVAAGAVAASHAFAARHGERLFIALLAAFGFLFFLQLVDGLPGPWLVEAALGTALTVGFVIAYRAQSSVRSVLSVLAVSPIVFVATFVFVSPTNAVVFPDDIEAANLSAALDDITGGESAGTHEPARPLSERLNDRFPSIYLLILDELPMASLLNANGEIDEARWPNFARLADTSHLFTNATTIGITTERAIPSILTGQNETFAAPVYSFYPENIFTLLGNIYDASESDPLVQLCPPSICNGETPEEITTLLDADDDTAAALPATTTTVPTPFERDEPGSGSLRLLLDDAAIVFGHVAAPDGLSLGLPEIGSSWGSFGDDGPIRLDEPDSTARTTTSTVPVSTTAPFDFALGETPEDDIVFVDSQAIRERNDNLLESLILNDSRLVDFDRDLQTIQPVNTPTLHVMHTLLPHVPWRFHADGQIYDDARLPGYASDWDDDPVTARAAQQRHLLQLAFVDSLLGRYLDQLESAGMFDRAILIVTADHGIAFNAGSEARGPDDINAGGIVGVPLFYKRPDQTTGEIYDRPVQTLDILPTIAAQLEIDIPWTIQGSDLFGPTLDRDRDVLHPFPSDLPEAFVLLREAVTADLIEFFGGGTNGSFYALAGLRERLGTKVSDLVDRPVDYCWVRERPDEIPDENGAVGFVFGHFRTPRPTRIPYAIAVDGTLAGTAQSLDSERQHRIYGLGDPTLWTDASIDDVLLYEIVDERLRPIRSC